MKARIPNQGGQANMMKKLQQMQDDMARVQKECEEAQYSASSGGGAVEVTLTAHISLFPLKFSPMLLTPRMLKCLKICLLRPSTRQCARQTKHWREKWAKLPAE